MVSKFKTSEWFRNKHEWVVDFNKNRRMTSSYRIDSWFADIWLGSVSSSYADENGWHDLYISDVMCLTAGKDRTYKMLRFLMPVTGEAVKDIKFEKGDRWAFVSIRRTSEMCNIISSAVRLEYDHSRRLLNLSDIFSSTQADEMSSGNLPLPE